MNTPTSIRWFIDAVMAIPGVDRVEWRQDGSVYRVTTVCTCPYEEVEGLIYDAEWNALRLHSNGYLDFHIRQS